MKPDKFSAVRKATHVYLGQGACGCYFVVVTDCGDKDTAKEVANMIRDGMTVSRLTFEEYRATNFGAPCPHKAKPQKQGGLFAEATK